MALPPNQVRVRNRTTEPYTFNDFQTGEILVLAGEQTAVIEVRFTANIDLTKILILEGVALTPPTPPPPGGSQFPANVPPYSILATQGTANQFAVVSFPADSILVRDGTGLIEAIDQSVFIANIVANLGGDTTFNGTLVQGTMTLIDLAPILIQPASAKLYINGLRIAPNLFTVVGTQVLATVALNEAYGGTGTDGLGFQNGWTITLDYRIVVP